MSRVSIDQKSRQLLDTFLAQTRKDYTKFIGFPAALDFDYTELVPTTTMFLNNIGDPHISSWHGAHTKEFEKEVVDFCANLFRAPADNYWGYVTNGSTECNLYALYMAREKLPRSVVYYSDAAHYSIPKNIHLLALDSVAVRTQPGGEMDYEHLRGLLAQHPDAPAIVVATIGTTMTEAKDNVATIKNILQEAAMPHHIHADAALAGVYNALLNPRHPFDFADGADSISTSGHKFFGSPTPCGIIIAKKQDKERLVNAFNYTGSIDSTISGSRNGQTPLFLWYAIRRFGAEGLRKRALEALDIAAYAHQQLLDTGWDTWRNPQALTVMLASPSREIITRWQLATHEGWSHIICMPGVTKAKVDEFISELRSARVPAPLPHKHPSIAPHTVGSR